MKIFTIGVGTTQGSLIPIEGNGEAGFVKDAKGQVVKSKLDENRLREIAQATGGIYLHLESGPQTMRQLYDGRAFETKDRRNRCAAFESANRALRMAAGRRDCRADRLPVHQRPKTCANSQAFAGKTRSAGRRLLLFVAAAEVNAASGIDLYNRGQYEDAYAQFQRDLQQNINPADMPKMQFDAGAAAYKLRNYDKALEAFSQSLVDRSPRLQEKSRYNLGRTLEDRADFGKTNEETLKDLENAAQHYEQALKLDPQDKAAAERLEIVRKKIEKLKQHPKQPPPQPQKNQQNKKDQKKDEQQNNSNSHRTNSNKTRANKSKINSRRRITSDNRISKTRNRIPRTRRISRTRRSGINSRDNPPPSPSPGREQKQPGQKKKDQQGAGESPTPSPGEDSSPSPSPGESGENPTPSPPRGKIPARVRMHHRAQRHPPLPLNRARVRSKAQASRATSSKRRKRPKQKRWNGER